MSEMARSAVWVVGSGIVAELLGYLLHRLLHSGWIRWLSASHMKHHMVLYGPLQKQRPSEHYMDATTDRLSIGNIGIEWLAPTAILLILAETTFWALGVRFIHQAVFVATVLAWSFVMFSYLHDRMHVKNFWMERNPVLKALVSACAAAARHSSQNAERRRIDGQELWHWLLSVRPIVRHIVPRAEFFQPPRLCRGQGEVQVRGDAAREVSAAGPGRWPKAQAKIIRPREGHRGAT